MWWRWSTRWLPELVVVDSRRAVLVDPPMPFAGRSSGLVRSSKCWSSCDVAGRDDRRERTIGYLSSGGVDCHIGDRGRRKCGNDPQRHEDGFLHRCTHLRLRQRITTSTEPQEKLRKPVRGADRSKFAHGEWPLSPYALSGWRPSLSSRTILIFGGWRPTPWRTTATTSRPAAAALEGLKLVVASKPDLVILDLGLPDLDGAELLRMLRAVSNVAVIVATAREGDEHVVAALDAGADDYLVKPYSIAQLEARVRAVLRRAESSASDPSSSWASSGSIGGPGKSLLAGRSARSESEGVRSACPAGRSGRRGGQQTRHPGRGLATTLWGRGPHGRCPSVVAAIEARGDGSPSPLLHTVHGVGVKLVPPGEALRCGGGSPGWRWPSRR